VPEVLERLIVELPAGTAPDERSARRTLQGQVDRLERELASLFASAWPRKGIDWTVPTAGRGPRLLDLGELEVLRDAMVERVDAARRELRAREQVEAVQRSRIEDMLRDPRSHRWERVRSADIGEHGCRNWHVLPRWGLIGMMADWWHVKISSGCP
jgi:hypothetical protein